MDAVPVRFGENASRGNPAQPMVVALPVLHLMADAIHCGEARLDAIRAGKALPLGGVLCHAEQPGLE